MKTLKVALVNDRLPAKLGALCYEGDRLSAALEITGAKAEFDYKLDTQNVITGVKDVLDLTNTNGTLSAVIDVLIPAGRYKVQLRTVGDIVEHSSIGEMVVEYSIDAIDSFDPNVPSEMAQIEERVTALRNETEDFAADAQISVESARAEADSAAGSAIQAADSAYEASQYAGQAAVDMNSRVDKSGDTMTGVLYAPMVKVDHIPIADEDVTNKAYVDGVNEAMQEFLDTIIPDQASAENQLADKAFVNSSVSTNTANYISDDGHPFTSVEALEAYTGTLTNNDYAFVVGTDSVGNTTYTRYKWTTVEWAEEFVLNNSSFTEAQWSAINSGITALLVASINAHLANTDIHVTVQDKSTWSNKQATITDLGTIRAGAAAGATAYQKPVGGIPEQDLSAEVQEKLNTSSGAVIDDTTIGADAWSSKHIVDTLCSPFVASGTMVQCYPVDGYPMTVASTADKVVRTGKNLLNANWKTYDASRWVTSGDYWIYDTPLPAGTYTVSWTWDKSVTPNPYSLLFIRNGSSTTGQLSVINNGVIRNINPYGTFTLAEGGKIRIQYAPYRKSGQTNQDVLNIIVTLMQSLQIEVGGEHTNYEEYNGAEFETLGGVTTVVGVDGLNIIRASDGSEITVTGRENPQHTIEKLTNAVISLGGNV